VADFAQPPVLQIFVPPVSSYASPFQNSNFETFAIPLTITNKGAHTGTVLSVTLVVTDLAKVRIRLKRPMSIRARCCNQRKPWIVLENERQIAFLRGAFATHAFRPAR
jgi:hypothetical protein